MTLTFLKGWKTIIFNIIMAGLLLLDKMGTDFGLSIEMIATITAFGNFILRFFTDTPATKSTPTPVVEK